MLSDLQRDALKEFMNISFGQAANLLSEMAEQKIELKIPEIKLGHISSLGENLNDEPLSNILKGHIVSSSLAFGNELKGKAHLIFPVKEGKILVSLFMGEEAPVEDDSLNEFSDTDIDAMKEIGNIILNTIVGSLANLLNKKITYSLPEIDFIDNSEQNREFSPNAGHYVLLIHTTFSLIKTRIEGVVFVILTMDSISILIGRIDETLVEIYG